MLKSSWTTGLNSPILSGSFSRRIIKGLSLGSGALLLSGCSLLDGSVLNPAGPIGEAEKGLLYFVGIVMLFILVPVYIMTIGFAWKYRASNKSADYQPHWDFSKPIAISTWVGPALIIALFGVVLARETYNLDPYKRISSPQKPIEIEAIALNWKWVFIYPEENIVTVNEIRFPTNAPVRIRITSDTVMNSFMVQGLGGQIYAMAGMETQLNLLSKRDGNFVGRNMMFSGNDFPDQTFTATSSSQSDYEQWLANIRASRPALTQADYEKIAKPEGLYPVTYFSAGGNGLFKNVIAKYLNGRTGAVVAPAAAVSQ